MKSYENNYLSEFEQEFELDSEAYDGGSNEFESTQDEFELGADSEFDNEFEQDSEFENDNEFDGEYNSLGNQYEAQLYELFSNEFESEFEFENQFNGIMHEMERDYFWGTLKKFAKKGLSAGMKFLPIGEKYKKMIADLAKGHLPSIRSLIKTLGPKAASFIPGVGPIVSSAMGAMMKADSEIASQNSAMKAAKSTVEMAKNAYTGFANGIASGVLGKSILPENLGGILKGIAQNSIKNAAGKVGNGAKSGNYTKVSRSGKNIMIEGKAYRIITSLYKLN